MSLLKNGSSVEASCFAARFPRTWQVCLISFQNIYQFRQPVRLTSNGWQIPHARFRRHSFHSLSAPDTQDNPQGICRTSNRLSPHPGKNRFWSPAWPYGCALWPMTISAEAASPSPAPMVMPSARTITGLGNRWSRKSILYSCSRIISAPKALFCCMARASALTSPPAQNPSITGTIEQDEPAVFVGLYFVQSFLDSSGSFQD